jgi:hypothetical protein
MMLMTRVKQGRTSVSVPALCFWLEYSHEGAGRARQGPEQSGKAADSSGTDARAPSSVLVSRVQ